MDQKTIEKVVELAQLKETLLEAQYELTKNNVVLGYAEDLGKYYQLDYKADVKSKKFMNKLLYKHHVSILKEISDELAKIESKLAEI